MSTLFEETQQTAEDWGPHGARLIALGAAADAALGYARHDGFEARMTAAIADMVSADAADAADAADDEDCGGDPVETCIDDILCAVDDYAIVRGLDGYYRLLWEGDGRAEAAVVSYIRSTCAAEFDLPSTSEFFAANYQRGETPDAALLRVFQAERVHHDSDHQTVLAMCHG